MEFERSMTEIRKRAREHMMKGAVTDAYGADPAKVCEVLNQVLATEIVCALRYRNNHYVALAHGAHRIADELSEHAIDEERHRDLIAERIAQLGGVPDFDPKMLVDRAHAEYTTSEDIGSVLRENLVAERVAVATYSEIVRWLANDDPTTRRLMEEILAQEEEHADDLVDLVHRVEARTNDSDGNGRSKSAS